MSRRKLKVAFVHEFLTQYGGAERVLEELLKLFPGSVIYTIIYDRNKMGRSFSDATIQTSPLQSFPLAVSRYKWYLPLMPWAIEQLELPSDLDLVISDSSAFAKGVRVPPGIPHLCYLHTPTRYLWSVRDLYVRDAPIPSWVRPFVGPVLDAQKRWDYLAAQRPDRYIANSRNVQRQLLEFYDRETADVLFPFVDIKRFQPAQEIGDYTLVLGRLEPIKRTDLVLEACARLGWPLKVAGTGSWLERYRRQYEDVPTIEFLGRVPDEALPDLYARAKVFVFPAQEDAGITPLEAMASGRPVLAYAQGGALESITPGVSGEFFTKQTPESVMAGLTGHDWTRYTKARIQSQAERFDVQAFDKHFLAIVDELVAEGRTHGH